jgi:nicotinate-nucleotide pyrophosphorylase (carboxylating)
MSVSWPRRAAHEAARRALAEDLAGFGDLAGAVFTEEARAQVVAREGGVLSGRLPFEEADRLVDERVVVRFERDDGERFVASDVLARLVGPADSILAIERTGLNFLGRLSGVATATARFVAETEGTKARIAATRKTTPGLRALEKMAVVHGGGLPHRFGLFDAAMIKDNHVRAAGGVAAAIAAVREALGHVHGLEVEVDDLDQLDEALAAGAAVVLLDNMSDDQVRAAVERVAGRAVVEVSGGVTLERARALAAAGVDVISAGALTTRSPWIDVALDLED